MSNSFSDRLFPVPLFNGFSRLDFIDIVGKIPFDCRTYRSRQPIVTQGEECTSLYIVLNGETECVTESPDHSYKFTETLPSPLIIQPECLFGLHTRYTHGFRANGEAQAVRLEKQSVRRLLTEYPVFQINFYNLLCTISQNSARLLWQKRNVTLEERFREFAGRRSLRPAGRKEIHIRMEDLASELGATRLRVSQMLAMMAGQGLLAYSRGVIVIKALEKL